LDLVENNSNTTNKLLSDKARYHVSGYVNKQNCCCWPPNIPHELQQHPLHNAEVKLWCAVSSHCIIGPYCFETALGRTVNVHAERYKGMPETFLCSELHPHQQHLLWFQQDGATAHTAQISMQVLRTFPADSFLCRGYQLPARSPDLAVPDYFLWGYIKSRIYKTHPANIAELKQRILERTQGIPKEMLQHVMTAFPS